jgi:hypothetical protein
MKRMLGMIALFLSLMIFVTACSATRTNDAPEASSDLVGPALVMFYTDN